MLKPKHLTHLILPTVGAVGGGLSSHHIAKKKIESSPKFKKQLESRPGGSKKYIASKTIRGALGGLGIGAGTELSRSLYGLRKSLIRTAVPKARVTKDRFGKAKSVIPVPDWLKGVTTKAEAKKKYREMAKKYHPDRNPGDKSAEERFKDIASQWKSFTESDEFKKLGSSMYAIMKHISGGPIMKNISHGGSKGPTEAAAQVASVAAKSKEMNKLKKFFWRNFRKRRLKYYIGRPLLSVPIAASTAGGAVLKGIQSITPEDRKKKRALKAFGKGAIEGAAIGGLGGLAIGGVLHQGHRLLRHSIRDSYRNLKKAINFRERYIQDMRSRGQSVPTSELSGLDADKKRLERLKKILFPKSKE
jgi:hypothetical protein